MEKYGQMETTDPCESGLAAIHTGARKDSQGGLLDST